MAKMQFQSTSKMPGKASNRAANRLTKRSKYCSVFHRTIEYRANHAECATTPHGSNPTLNYPVHGLRSIILSRRLLVLRGTSSPTDFSVGVGCLVFRTGRG